MIVVRTPRRPSWLASIRPVGPAPTTRTSVIISISLDVLSAGLTAKSRSVHRSHTRRIRRTDARLSGESRPAEVFVRPARLQFEARQTYSTTGDATESTTEFHRPACCQAGSLDKP